MRTHSLVLLVAASAIVASPSRADRLYVNDNPPTATEDGAGWATAMKDLQDAIAAAEADAAIDEIWVATGRYQPHDTNASASFDLPDGVSIYGGFAGNESALEDRAGLYHATFLTGDLAGNDGTTGDLGDNSYHVVDASGVATTAVLDGFTLLGGNGVASHAVGSALYVASATGFLRVVNCHFRGNRSKASGGAVYVQLSNVCFERCRFTSNTTTEGGSGGGAAFHSQADVTYIDCRFDRNTAAAAGGAIFDQHSTVKIVSCAFRGNTSTGSVGGGLYCTGSSTLEVVGTTFVGNTAHYGGAIADYGAGILTLTNSTIAGNVATDEGGGLWGAQAATHVKNSIFWGNVDAGGDVQDAQISLATDGGVIIDYSCVQDSVPGDGLVIGGIGSVGNTDKNPLFVRPPHDGGDGWGQPCNDDYGDLRLAASSTLLDAADNGSVPPDEKDLDTDGDTEEPTPLDHVLEPRFVDDPAPDTGNGLGALVDMGAFERGAGHGPYSAEFLGCGVNPTCSLYVLHGEAAVGSALTLGVDNPLGTQAAPAASFVLVSVLPDPAYPCGTPIPGWGMSAPGAAGELLVGFVPPDPVAILLGGPWLGPGQPGEVLIEVPPNPGLAGATVYAQGLVFEAAASLGIQIGLTEGIALRIGK